MLNKKRSVVCCLIILLATCALTRQSEAQVINSLGRSMVVRVVGSGMDTVRFAYPPALGYSAVLPDTNQINPPDVVAFGGNSAVTVTQLTGALADSIRLYMKPLTFAGNLVLNDSVFVLGSASTYLTAVGGVGSTYGDNDAGSGIARLGGVAIFLKVGDVPAQPVRTFRVTFTTGSTYDVRPR